MEEVQVGYVAHRQAHFLGAKGLAQTTQELAQWRALGAFLVQSCDERTNEVALDEILDAVRKLLEAT